MVVEGRCCRWHQPESTDSGRDSVGFAVAVVGVVVVVVAAVVMLLLSLVLLS